MNSFATHQRFTRSLGENSGSLIIGLDTVGCGFDITLPSQRRCLLDLERASDISNWTDPYNASRQFIVPFGFYARDVPESVYMLDTRLIHTIQQYFERSIYTIVQENSGFLGFGATRSTTEIGSLYRRLYEQNYNVALTVRQIIWYVLSVTTFPPPRLNKMATLALARLPKVFDPSNSIDSIKFKQFFDAYGTHIIISAAMGGLVWEQDYLETCLLEMYNISWISRQIKERSWFGLAHSETYSHDETITDIKTFEEHSSYDIRLLGGTESLPVSKWQEWVPTTRYEPRPVSYTLRPIYTLLPINSPQRYTLEAATLFYRRQADANASLYIDYLRALPKPPPANCKPPSKRRRKRSFSITSAARRLLCPFVGREGLTCPGSMSRTILSIDSLRLDPNNYYRLPLGVGIGFDLGTGELKFPVLDWNFDNPIKWQEHVSTRIFLIPETVELVPIFNDSSGPEVSGETVYHFFSDSITDPSRSIMGGFFSQQSNPSEYYDKYYSKAQNPVIRQNSYRVLYTLEISTSKLNTVANSAVAQLTRNYDVQLYAEFLQVWGTHVTINTTVGGMIETQTQAPACRLRTTTTTPTTRFTRIPFRCDYQPYLSRIMMCPEVRRKKRQDSSFTERRYGGDLTIENPNSWKSTIGQNPALLSINHYIPWSDLVSDPTVKTNLETAIATHLDNAKKTQATAWANVEQQKAGKPLCGEGWTTY